MESHNVYCFSRNGAAIKCHDTAEKARAQAISFALGDTALGQDRVHPEKANNARYTVETLRWTGNRYEFVSVEVLEVERDRAAARKILGLTEVAS